MSKLCSLLLSVVLAAAVVTSGFAQNLSAGAKVGIDFADLGGDFEDIVEASTDLKTGLSVGGFFGIDLHRLFRVQAEGQYVQKGAKVEEAGVEGTFKVNYLELLFPLTLLIPVEGGTLTPRIYVGPTVAFELSCDVEIEEADMSLEVECEDPLIGAETKSVDFGVLFGGGVDLMVGPGAITVDALYNLGLADINDTPGDPLEAKNRNLQILLGYSFRFGS